MSALSVFLQILFFCPMELISNSADSNYEIFQPWYQ